MPEKRRKLRVLSQEDAKVLSSSSPAPELAPFSESQYPSASQKPATPSASKTSQRSSPSTPRFCFSSFLRARYAALPRPARQTFRSLKVLAPILPIGLFFSEHVMQVLWVNGPSMTPYLNEDYDTMHTKKDIVLVNMWPFGGAGFSLPWREERKRRLERGMVVLFRYVV